MNPRSLILSDKDPILSPDDLLEHILNLNDLVGYRHAPYLTILDLFFSSSTASKEWIIQPKPKPGRKPKKEQTSPLKDNAEVCTITVLIITFS